MTAEISGRFSSLPWEEDLVEEVLGADVPGKVVPVDGCVLCPPSSSGQWCFSQPQVHSMHSDWKLGGREVGLAPMAERVHFLVSLSWGHRQQRASGYRALLTSVQFSLEQLQSRSRLFRHKHAEEVWFPGFQVLVQASEF